MNRSYTRRDRNSKSSNSSPDSQVNISVKWVPEHVNGMEFVDLTGEQAEEISRRAAKAIEDTLWKEVTRGTGTSAEAPTFNDVMNMPKLLEAKSKLDMSFPPITFKVRSLDSFYRSKVYREILDAKRNENVTDLSSYAISPLGIPVVEDATLSFGYIYIYQGDQFKGRVNMYFTDKEKV